MTWNEAIDSFSDLFDFRKITIDTNSVEAYLNDIRKLGAYCEQRTLYIESERSVLMTY